MANGRIAAAAFRSPKARQHVRAARSTKWPRRGSYGDVGPPPGGKDTLVSPKNRGSCAWALARRVLASRGLVCHDRLEKGDPPVLADAAATPSALP